MFDYRAAKEDFRAAVHKLTSRGDPHSLAAILQVPPVSPNKREGSKSSASQEILQADNGTDWSGVFNAWLDACEASAGVRT